MGRRLRSFIHRYKRFRRTCLQEYSASHPKDTSLHKPCCHDITLLQHVTSKAIDITTHKLPYAPPALSRKKALHFVHRAYFCAFYETVISGAFRNLRKATISFVMSVQEVCMCASRYL